MGMYVSKGARKKIVSERKKSFLTTMVKGLIAEAEKLEISRKELIELINENMEGDVR